MVGALFKEDVLLTADLQLDARLEEVNRGWQERWVHAGQVYDCLRVQVGMGIKAVTEVQRQTHDTLVEAFTGVDTTIARIQGVIGI